MKKIILFVCFISFFCGPLCVSAENDYFYYGEVHSFSRNAKDAPRKDVELVFDVFLVIFLLFFVSVNGANAFFKKGKSKNFIGDDDNKISRFLPNMSEKELIEKLYKKYLDVQIAFTNFDLKELRKLCSDELYHFYQTNLKMLKMNKKKKVFDNFENCAANISDITIENDIMIVDLYLHVRYHEYVVNSMNGEFISGDMNKKVDSQSHLKFIMRYNSHVKNCPSCGAVLKKGMVCCSYCNTFINDNYDSFVLSSIDEI